MREDALRFKDSVNHKSLNSCQHGIKVRVRFVVACGFRRKPATHSDAKPSSVPI